MAAYGYDADDSLATLNVYNMNLTSTCSRGVSLLKEGGLQSLDARQRPQSGNSNHISGNNNLNPIAK